MYFSGKNKVQDDTVFLQSLQKDFNVSFNDLEDKFKAVSYSRNDLIEYLTSGGQKKHLLWHPEEDMTIQKHCKNPNHHLMKLILRLKGNERLERRLKFFNI